MRKFIIDTDTGSDDAIAIVMALRDPSVKVEAIVSVAGNVVVEQATTNALIAVEQAGTYQPPVYEGIGTPFIRTLETAGHVHGQDGLGDQGYTTTLKKAEGNGVTKILQIVKDNDDIEIVALGPLTNVATAIVMDRAVMSRVKHIYLMGGAFLGGNVTPNAEFNIWADPEAADIVFKSGIPITMSPFENCKGPTVFTPDEYTKLEKVSKVGEFFVKCNASLILFNELVTGKKGISMPDPCAMALALYDDCDDNISHCFVDIETDSEINLGRTSCDIQDAFGRPANANVCINFNHVNFKKHIFDVCKIENK